MSRLIFVRLIAFAHGFSFDPLGLSSEKSFKDKIPFLNDYMTMPQAAKATIHFFKGAKAHLKAPVYNLKTPEGKNKPLLCKKWMKFLMQWEGRSRNFFMYIPEKYCDGKTKAPAFVWIHGLNTGADLYFHMLLEVMEKRETQYILILPSALWGSFNGGECCSFAQKRGFDDIGWVVRITELAKEMVPYIDDHRIFGLGYSMGAYLLSWLARTPENPLAGLALISGITSYRWNATYLPPVPVHIVHSENDWVVKYQGCCKFGQCMSQIVHETCLSIPQHFEKYLKVNGCSGMDQFVDEKHIPKLYDSKCYEGRDCTVRTRFCSFPWAYHFNDVDQLQMLMAQGMDSFEDTPLVVPEGVKTKGRDFIKNPSRKHPGDT